MKNKNRVIPKGIRFCFRFLTSFYLLLSCAVVSLVTACSVFSTSQQTIITPLEVQDVVIHQSFSGQTQINQWSIEEGGNSVYDPSQLGMGLVRSEDKNTLPNQLPQNYEFSIRSTEPMSVNLIVSAAKDSTFLITAMLDYKQVPFSLDGQMGLLHEISVKKGGDLYLPIQIEINKPGAHDLMILAFVDPYNRPWDSEARTNANGCRYIGFRTVVIVDGVNKPVITITPDVLGVPPPTGLDFGVRALFADPPLSPLDTSHPSRRQMKMTANGRPGRTFRYQLWVSDYDLPDDVVDYGLLRFLDFHQIGFKGKDFFVAHLDGRQEVIIDDMVTLPSQSGIHELQVFYVFGPYKSILRGEVLSNYVFASTCLGINVNPSIWEK